MIQKIAVISIRGKMLKNCIEEERKVYTSHFKTEFGNKYQQYVPFSVVRRNTGSHCLQLFNHNWLNTEQSEQALSNSNCFASVNKMEEAQPHNYVKVGNFWRLIFEIKSEQLTNGLIFAGWREGIRGKKNNFWGGHKKERWKGDRFWRKQRQGGKYATCGFTDFSHVDLTPCLCNLKWQVYILPILYK